MAGIARPVLGTGPCQKHPPAAQVQLWGKDGGNTASLLERHMQSAFAGLAVKIQRVGGPHCLTPIFAACVDDVTPDADHLHLGRTGLLRALRAARRRQQLPPLRLLVPGRAVDL